MQYSSSLKLNHIFRRLYRKGHTCANRYLAIYCRKNGQACNRIGLTVNAKLGCAVRRNRLHETQFLPGYDIVVVVRGRAMDAPYRELEQAYLSLAEKLSLLRHEDTQ